MSTKANTNQTLTPSTNLIEEQKSSSMSMDHNPKTSSTYSILKESTNHDNTSNLPDMLSLIKNRLADTKLDIIQKKKQSYELLKNWEKQKNEIINEKNSYFKSIKHNIVQRIRISMDGIDSLIKFFKNRLYQEQYVKKAYENVQPRLYYYFEGRNDESTWVLPQVLKELEGYQEQIEENTSNLAFFIEKRILHDIFYYEQIDYEQKCDALNEKVLQASEDSLQKAEKKNASYRVFCDLYNAHMTNKNLDQDLHAKELEYYEDAFQELKSTEVHGKAVLEFLKEVSLLESKRYSLIKLALTEYFEKMKEVYTGQYDTFSSILANFDPCVENNKIFDIEHIMTRDELLTLKSNYRNPNFNMDDLANYLTKIEIELIDQLPLVINYWRVELIRAGQMAEQPATIAMTYDNNIIILSDEKVLPYKLPKYVLRMNNVTFANDEHQSKQIEFNEKRKGRFFGEEIINYILEFPTLEEKTLFLQLYQKYQGILH